MKPDKAYVPLKPFLITKNDDGMIRLTVRETRYNSQGYPLVTATVVDQSFETATKARQHAAAEFRAKPGEFAMK